MKISQIIVETTSGATASGSIAPMETAFTQTQSRNASIYGDKKVGSLFKGKKTKKPFANSINEGKKVDEAKLEEDDLIIAPRNAMKRKTGLVPRGQSRVDHEVEMARSDLVAAMKNAKSIYELIKDRSEDEGLEGWVQEKIIKATDYLNAVKEYYDGKMYQNEMTGGVIAGGGVGEDETDSLQEMGSKLLSAQDVGGVITIKVQAPDGTPRTFSNKNPSIMQQWLDKYGLMLPRSISSKFVYEEELDEKFKSKQQAKLMYAVAGDKDVAKKTGVSQKVAKEYIRKSKKQDIKSLPKTVKKG